MGLRPRAREARPWSSAMIYRIKILNYDVEGKQSNYKQKVSFMPDRSFRMLLCSPSGSAKTNPLLDMIYRLLYFDKIYLFAKNLQQSKYQPLIDLFEPISKEAGYPIIEASNDKLISLDKMPCDNKKLVIVDDYLTTGATNDAEIHNYETLLIQEIRTVVVFI